ncbi:MAG: hypothetical protein Roseis2KO_18260 [Roseivirga sp.]
MIREAIVIAATFLALVGGSIFIWNLIVLVTEYGSLSSGEGWGVVSVFGILFWSGIAMGLGLFLRSNFKKPKEDQTS